MTLAIKQNGLEFRSMKKIHSWLNPTQESFEKFSINPWFVTGFTDGEGCFTISITKKNESKIGWEVKLSFQITLNQKDKAILEKFQSFFDGGYITKQGLNNLQYRVQSVKDLLKVINHFVKYPLLTKKQSDCLLFIQAFYLVLNKEHLTIDGLYKILAIKASMNLGLSSLLKEAFPNIVALPRPETINQKILNPQWLAGFTSGEGCFYIKIFKSNTKLGKAVLLTFQLTQHSKDEQLIRNLVYYLDCGRVSINREAIYFDVTKSSDLIDKVIPFFKKYQIEGVKHKDFCDFCRVAELVKNRTHLTKDGLDQIRQIKEGMNKGRS